MAMMYSEHYYYHVHHVTFYFLTPYEYIPVHSCIYAQDLNHVYCVAIG